jgi:hypothetical protein
MLCFVKAFVVWIVLVYVSINLIGYVVRGLFEVQPQFDKITDERSREFFEREASKSSVANIVITLFFAGATVAFVIALYHYWNIALTSAAVIVMVARLPDLLWEIQNGRDVKQPKGAVYYLAGITILLCFPLTWYALCG